MKENNTSTKQSWVKFLTHIPGLNRITVIKNLFLEKLDFLNTKTDILLDNSSPIMVGITRLVESAESLSENLRFSLQQTEDFNQKISALVEQNQDLQHKVKVVQERNFTFQDKLSNFDQKLNDFDHKLNDFDHKLNDFDHKLNEIKLSTQFIVIKENSNLDPDTRLMSYLYSFLPHRKAIDIGANKGDVSFELIKAGYEVYAFEPFPETFSRLNRRFSYIDRFHGLQLALGATDEFKELFVAEDQSSDQRYKDSTFYHSLIKHSTPNDLLFIDSVSVEVRSLKSLHENNIIPMDIDLVKIDTEGYDLEVLKGMDNHKYSVVVTEFWDKSFPFGRSNANNYLSEMATEMKQRGYHWSLTIYRVWGSEDISFYCNNSESIENSWGNVFFFQDHEIFLKAMQWCSSVLRSTYFL